MAVATFASEDVLVLTTPKPNAQSSTLNAQRPKLKAQSPTPTPKARRPKPNASAQSPVPKAQRSKLKARSPKLKAQPLMPRLLLIFLTVLAFLATSFESAAAQDAEIGGASCRERGWL